jgi:hypothetical protein
MTDIFVVTPVKDGRDHLPALHATLVEQDADRSIDVHWIVVDDGSRDGGPGLVEHLVRRSTMDIQLLHTDGAVGPGRARNLGLEHLLDAADDGIITFVDVDDNLEPGALVSWSAAVRRHGADMLLTGPPDAVRGRMRARLGEHDRMLDGGDIWDGEFLRGWAVWGKAFQISLVRAMPNLFADSFEAEDLYFFVSAVITARRVAVCPSLPRYVYIRPTRSGLRNLPAGGTSNLGTIGSALQLLRDVAPDRARYLKGTSPISAGICAATLRALAYAVSDTAAEAIQRRARDELRAAELDARALLSINPRDRAVFAAGLTAISLPPGLARRLARLYIASRA